MAISLGSLFVDLKANVAEYLSGMSAAAYASRHASREIKESFEGLGGVLQSVLGPLGEVGAVIGETFSKVGSFAGDAAANFGKVGGALGLVGAGAGIAVGALVAVEAGAIAIALHGAEAAAQLEVLSEKSGVSTEALSGLGFAAKQSHVDMETLVKGLEKLNKSVFAAATAPASAQNAYTRLGISLKDAEGNLRSTEDIFLDVAGKIAGIESPVARGALAIQIFGKSGAELLPLLNKGKQGIEEFIETAKKLGLVIDGETAAAAHHFEQTLNQLKAAGEGASLKLSKELLPAMQAVATSISEGLSEKGSGLDDLISGTKTLTQYFVSFGGIVALVFKELGALAAEFISETEIRVEGLIDVVKLSAKFDGKGIVAAMKDTTIKVQAVQDVFLAKSKQNWTDYTDLIANAFKETITGPAEKPKDKTDIDLSKEEVDKRLESIRSQLAALRQQAVAQLELAQKTGLAGAAQRIQTADNEAAAVIQKLNAEADKTTGKEKAKLKAIIEQETTAIIANAREKVVAADAVKLNQSLQKESEGFAANIVSLQALVDAYAAGGSAIAQAQIDKDLEANRIKVAELDAEYQKLFATEGASADDLAKVATALKNATEELDVQEAQLKQRRALSISLTIGQETRAFQDQLPAIEAISEAYLRSAEAVRAAQVELKVSQFRTANPAASEDQVARIRELYQAQSDAAKAAQISQEAAALSLTVSYTNQIARLKDIKAALIENKDSTILVDAAIFDENQKLIRQYDAAALRIGDFGDKTRAVLNEIALDGQNFGENLFHSFGSAITGLEDKLAELVVTGKANFRELLQSFEKQLASAEIKKIFSSVASGLNNSLFGGALPGLGSGKADGSSASPFHVIPVDSSGNVIGGLFGKAGGEGKGSIIGDITGASNGENGTSSIANFFSGLTSKIGGFFSSLVGSLGSIIGSIGHSIGSVFSGIFGGFLADGGDVSPGKLYVVGEKKPEFFSPKRAGQVTPSLSAGGGTRVFQIENHFHGVVDHDSFKKSEIQISSFFGSSIAAAQARTR